MKVTAACPALRYVGVQPFRFMEDWTGGELLVMGKYDTAQVLDWLRARGEVIPDGLSAEVAVLSQSCFPPNF